jgi:hypothetical protein
LINFAFTQNTPRWCSKERGNKAPLSTPLPESHYGFVRLPGEEFTKRCLVSILNRSSNKKGNNFAAARPTYKQRNRCLESWYAPIFICDFLTQVSKRCLKLCLSLVNSPPELLAKTDGSLLGHGMRVVNLPKHGLMQGRRTTKLLLRPPETRIHQIMDVSSTVYFCAFLFSIFCHKYNIKLLCQEFRDN